MLSPFEREHVNAWTSELVDVASLNAAASDAVLSCVDRVRAGAAQGTGALETSSLLVLGPAGAGKTHLFARLRRRCGHRAAFVLRRPEIAVDPTPRHLLATCVDALQRQVVGAEGRQMDAVIGAALASLTGGDPRFPFSHIHAMRSLPTLERQDLIARAVESVEALSPEVETSWLERLFGLPFSDGVDRRASLVWLSGRQPSEAQLRRTGEFDALSEASVLPALQSLCLVAAFGSPIVLVFDQLENLVEDDPGQGRIHAHARFFCELFDTVRGLVMVQLVLDAEWNRRIRPVLSASERSRLEARLHTLALPTPAEREALLVAWRDEAATLATEPLPVFPWPLSREAWQRWRDSPGVTPRMLMIACREALEEPLPKGSLQESAASSGEPSRDETCDDLLDDHLAEIFEQARAQARRSVDVLAEEARGLDAEPLVGGLASALRLVPSVEILSPASRARHDLEVRTPLGRVLVFVVQQPHPLSVAASLRKAIDMLTQGSGAPDRVVVLREAALGIPPTWKKVRQHWQELSDLARARVVELQRAEVVDLLALGEIAAAARSQDLSAPDGMSIPEDAVHRWVVAHLAPEGWRVIGAVMGRAEEPATSDAPRRQSHRGLQDPGHSVASATGAGDSSAPTRKRPAASPPGPVSGRPTDRGVPQAEERPPWPPEEISRAILRSGVTYAVLKEKRLLSVDRLLREVIARDAAVSPRQVLSELRGLGAEVRFFGRSLVYLTEGS